MDDPTERLDEIETRSREAAEAASDAFEAAGERIASALDRAARSGEMSFNRMAESILRDLARTAVTDLITDPLSRAIGGLGQAKGGSSGPAPVNVTMNVSGVADAAGLERSRGQIAAGLARSVATGQRYGG